MKIEILCRFSARVLFSVDAESVKLAVEMAIEKKINLDGANLDGANLEDANLEDANLKNGEKIAGSNRPFITISPLGYDGRQLLAFSTDKGLRIHTGCFFGTEEEFMAALKKKHGDNQHGQEYGAALALIKLPF